jgi:DNA-binding GntR family transcriptional regulator
MAQKHFNPQYSLPLVQQIHGFLTNAIIDGRLKNGQRLVENELQREFKISRAPIREAFRILEKNGLVVIIPRKGTFVREITRKDIEELFPIRAWLERLAAQIATSHLKPQDIEAMELALSGMTEAARRKNFKSYFEHHLKFHEIFINASKNDTLIGILENLRRQALWFRFSYLWHEEKFEYAIRAHREILDLFVKKNGDSAGTLVEQHILIAMNEFLRFLASRTSKE